MNSKNELFNNQFFVNDIENELDKATLGIITGTGISKTSQENTIQEIHIRIQKRNGKKSITTVQGLSQKEATATHKKLVKKLCCGGSVKEDEKYGTILQLNGDQREEIKTFLITTAKMPESRITIHGF